MAPDRIHSIRSVSVKNKRVIVRVDFDVPIKNKKAADTFRVEANMATLSLLREKGAHIRIIAHRGRPGGGYKREFSLLPLVPVLQKCLGAKIVFIKNPFDKKEIRNFTNDPRILLFENIRFWPGE